MNLLYFRRPKLIGKVDALVRELVDADIHSLVLAPEMGDLKLTDPDDCRTLKQLRDTYGINTPAIHGLFRHRNDLNSDDPAPMVSAHCALLKNVAPLGVKTYVVHCGLPIAGRTHDQEWDAVRLALDGIVPVAEETGIIIALENLPPEYLGNHPDMLIELVESYQSPNLRLCFDSGHAHMCGNAADTLHQMAPYVVTMHLHDNDGHGDRHLSPLDGTMNWDELVQQIRQCPNLVHMEIESFNREGRGHAELWAVYTTVLGDI